MFGYVQVHKPELKIKEFETYKAVYCSLCDNLSKEYGLWARLTLNYDFTFLAILLLAVEEKEAKFHLGRCKLNPIKKCLKTESDIFSYVSACAMLMLYYKVQDNWQDGSFLDKVKCLFLLPFAKLARKKAKKRFPEIDVLIASSMKEQEEVEEKQSKSIDEASHASAQALGRITAYLFSQEKENLYKFGYYIGRWVYLIDAVDDLENDIKKHNYNPFIELFDLKHVNERNKAIEHAKSALNLTANEIHESYQNFAKNRFNAILENIVTDGLYQVEKDIFGRMELSN